MKIRTGFVSNSSSSSFLLIGKYIKKEEISEANLDNLYFFGKYLSDGRDIFQPTHKQLEAIILNDFDGYFFEAYQTEENETTMTPKFIKELANKNEKISVICETIDYHSSTINEYFSYEDFIERYKED